LIHNNNGEKIKMVIKKIELRDEFIVLKCPCNIGDGSTDDCDLPSPLVAEDDEGNCYHACPVHGWFVIKSDGDIDMIDVYSEKYIKLLKKIEIDE
jgi:hypothetical protein